MKQLFFKLRVIRPAFFYIVALTVAASQAVAGQPEQGSGPGSARQALENAEELPGSKTAEAHQDSKDTEPVKLDLKTTVQYALQWNREVAIIGYYPLIAQEELQAANSVYDITLFSTGGIIRDDRPTQTILDTGSEEIDALIEDRWVAQVGLKKHFSTGGMISIYQEVDFLDSNSELVTPNPQNTSRLRTQLRQPLLKNIGDPENSAKIETANVNISVSSEEERQQLINIIYNVINSYWQVHLERSLFDLNKEHLQMAKNILCREESRFAQGLSKQLDVDRAISAIKNRHSRLLRNENRLQTEVNQLKLLLNLPQLPPGSSPLDVIPIETPVVDLPVVSLEESLADGLKNRPEIKLSRNKLKIAEINKKLADRLYLPTLDARLDYTLSSLGTSERQALESVYNNSREGWSAWLDFEYPIGNKGAQAEYRKSQLEYRQAQDKLLHAQEVVQKEIRSYLQDVTLSNQQIEVTLEAQQAAKRVLKSELARYEIDRITNKDLLQAQEILAVAKREHLRSLIYYNLKLAQLNRAKGSLFEMVSLHPIHTQAKNYTHN